jgi:hypothetical protein
MANALALGLDFGGLPMAWDDREGDGALATCAATATARTGFGLPATDVGCAAPKIAAASVATATAAAREARVRRLGEVVGTGRGDEVARSLSAGTSCLPLRKEGGLAGDAATGGGAARQAGGVAQTVAGDGFVDLKNDVIVRARLAGTASADWGDRPYLGFKKNTISGIVNILLLYVMSGIQQQKKKKKKKRTICVCVWCKVGHASEPTRQ